MYWLVITVLSFTLFLIAYQDLKYRAVPIYLFILLFGLSIWLANLQAGWLQVGYIFAINSGIILFMTGLLYLFYSLQKGREEGFFNTKLGIGDLLFWLAVTPLFSPVNYLLWLIFSLAVTLIVYVIWQFIKPEKNESKKIPLAGLQAITLLIIYFLNAVFFHKNLSQDIVSLTEIIL